MPFWVYILRCADGSFYTGHTDNLEQRVAQHQAGAFPGYTHKRRPVTLVWSQEMPTRFDALDAERIIKPWSRKKKEGLIAGDWAKVSYFARPPRERASTSLGTSGVEESTPTNPFEPSKVPARPQDLSHQTNPFVPSEVEAPSRKREGSREDQLLPHAAGEQ